jgi:hypothetical protein
MSAISNDSTRCEVLNLGSAPKGRGPFAIRQEGTPPGDTTLKQYCFLLRNDGVWVLNLTVFSLTEQEQQRFLYPTSASARKTLASLQGNPVVEAKTPGGLSGEELITRARDTARRLRSGLSNDPQLQFPRDKPKEPAATKRRGSNSNRTNTKK